MPAPTPPSYTPNTYTIMILSWARMASFWNTEATHNNDANQPPLKRQAVELPQLSTTAAKPNTGAEPQQSTVSHSASSAG
jgi:hypothetical protein